MKRVSSCVSAAVLTAACALPTENLTSGNRDPQSDAPNVASNFGGEATSAVEAAPGVVSEDPNYSSVSAPSNSVSESVRISESTLAMEQGYQAMGNDLPEASSGEVTATDEVTTAEDELGSEGAVPKSEDGSSKQDEVDSEVDLTDAVDETASDHTDVSAAGADGEAEPASGDSADSDVIVELDPHYCEGSECGFCQGTCAGSACEARQLVEDVGQVTVTGQRLHVVGETLFWVDNLEDSVRMWEPDSEQPQTVASCPGVLALTIDDQSNLFFITRTTAHGCVLGSCEPRQLAQTGAFEPPIFTVHDTALFLFQDLGVDSNLVTCDKQTCVDFPMEVGRAYEPTSLAWDGTTLYFADGNANNQGRGRILALDPGEPAKSVAADQVSPSSLHVADGYLYWAEDSFAGSVKRCALDGGECAEIETLVDGFIDGRQVRFPASVQVRGERVIWSNGGTDGAVFSCPASGCDRDVYQLTDSIRGPGALTLSDHCAFWIDEAGSLWTQTLP